MTAALTSLVLIMAFVVIYILFIEVYTVLFRLTGLTREKASFQTISLLTSVGFTTRESEIIASHKTRRKIATAAMITGYTFSVVIVSLIINLLLKINVNQMKASLKVTAIIFGAFILLLILIRLPFIRKGFDKLVEKLASKLLRGDDGQNVITLLDTYGKNSICEIYISKLPAVFVGKTLWESGIKDDYDLNILMLKRKDKFLDITRNTMFQEKDSIIVFGPSQQIKDLFGSVSSKEEPVKEKDNSKKNMMELIDNYSNDAMVEIKVNVLPEFLKGKALITSKLKENYDITVLMIKRDNHMIQVNSTSTIQDNDSIIVFGPFKKIKSAFNIGE